MEDKRLPFVSIVVCTFNRSDCMDACVESLRAQAYPRDRYEIILVDDASTDATKEIVSINGVTFIRHKTNKGISAARNTGIAAAKGEIVAFIDDDAIADPQWLMQLVQPFENPEIAATGGRTFVYKTEYIAERYLAANGYGNPAPLAFGKSKNPLWRFSVYLKSMFVPVTITTKPMEVQAVYGLNCAYRASVLKTVGGFDEKLFADEDSELSTRLHSHGAHIIFVPDAIIHHRHREGVIKLIRQTYRRSESTVYYYAKENKTLPIFPLPILYIVVTIGLMIFQPIIGVIFIVVGPLILYSWWPIRAFQERKIEYLLYGYIQLSLELSSILGIVRKKYFP